MRAVLLVLILGIVAQIERLEPLIGLSLDPPRLAAELAPILRPQGRSDRLWSAVLPGVTSRIHADSG